MAKTALQSYQGLSPKAKKAFVAGVWGKKWLAEYVRNLPKKAQTNQSATINTKASPVKAVQAPRTGTATSWMKGVTFGKPAKVGGTYQNDRNQQVADTLSNQYSTQNEINTATAQKAKSLWLFDATWARDDQKMKTLKDITSRVKPLNEQWGQVTPWQEWAYGAQWEVPGMQDTWVQGTDQFGTQTPTVWTTEWMLWYNRLPEEFRNIVDGMDPAQKKMMDQMAGNDLNGQLEYLRQYKRETEYAQKQRETKETITGIQWETLEIQKSQRIQQAQDSINNLKQNIAYLWSQGMPGKSAVQADAVVRQIERAEQAFVQMKKIEANAEQMRELWIEIDSAWYEKQMADMQDQLNQAVTSSIQWAMNAMSAADMAGELDTIDGIQQFKRSMLEKLDNNIEGYTKSSMQQMQYVTEQQMKMADEATQRIIEYNENKNVVNEEMSNVQGFYVDGNGSPIVSASTGQILQIPEEAPMKPVFDKDTGNLIQFWTDENGQIVASVDKVMQGAQDYKNFQMQQQQGYEMENLWAETQAKKDLMWYQAWLEAQEVAWINFVPWQPGQESMLAGKFAYKTPTEEEFAKGQQWLYNKMDETQNIVNWKVRWQCGMFVNDYLKEMWVVDQNLFKDPIEIRKTKINSETPSEWSVAIFDFSNSPNASPAWKKRWHVAVVQSVNWDGTITIKESNVWGDEKIHTRTVNADTVHWYFDPRMAEQSQQEQEQASPATLWDIYRFNDKTSRRNMSKKEINKLATEKDNIMSNPDASMEDILNWSAWGKEVGATQSVSFEKFEWALTKIDGIYKQIDWMETWPILWRLREMNPYDTDAQVLKAQLTALIPEMARGVYGEVGVLTEDDVRLYTQTIPNLKSTEAVNKGILAFNLDVLAWWYKKKLRSLAGQGYDVGWLEGSYEDIKRKSDQLKQQVGIPLEWESQWTDWAQQAPVSPETEAFRKTPDYADAMNFMNSVYQEQ